MSSVMFSGCMLMIHLEVVFVWEEFGISVRNRNNANKNNMMFLFTLQLHLTMREDVFIWYHTRKFFFSTPYIRIWVKSLVLSIPLKKFFFTCWKGLFESTSVWFLSNGRYEMSHGFKVNRPFELEKLLLLFFIMFHYFV